MGMNTSTDCIRCSGFGVVSSRNGKVAKECPTCKGTGKVNK